MKPTEMEKYPRLIRSDNSVIIQINSSPFSLSIHCSLEKVNNHWILKDTNTYGTSINGTVLESTESPILMNGDIINFDGQNENYVFHSVPGGSICDELQVTTEVAGPSNIPQECTTEREIPNAISSSDSYNWETIQDEIRCPICYEMFVKATTLNCSHTLCEFCIKTWRKTKTDCPVCRANITSMNPTLVLDNVAEMVVQNGSEEDKQHRKKVLEDRQKCVEQSKHENGGPSSEEPHNPGVIQNVPFIEQFLYLLNNNEPDSGNGDDQESENINYISDVSISHIDETLRYDRIDWLD